jgi:hypothetical protein
VAEVVESLPSPELSLSATKKKKKSNSEDNYFLILPHLHSKCLLPSRPYFAFLVFFRECVWFGKGRYILSAATLVAKGL